MQCDKESGAQLGAQNHMVRDIYVQHAHDCTTAGFLGSTDCCYMCFDFVLLNLSTLYTVSRFQQSKINAAHMH